MAISILKRSGTSPLRNAKGAFAYWTKYCKANSLCDFPASADIVTATDPRTVEQHVEDTEFDLIFLDIRMPHINGFELCERLSANMGDDDYLPVIIVTAQTDKETRNKSLSLGARDFITKPFENQEVLLRTRNALQIRAL